MNALIFVLDAVIALIVIGFLLRVLMPAVRADFRNPIGEAVLKLTNPLVLPLRRVFGPVGKFDIAALIALIIVQLAGTALLLALSGVTPGPATVARLGLLGLLRRVIQFYQVAILIHALSSWLAPGQWNPALQLLSRVCEPVLGPIRRVIPPIGGLDLSPLVALIGLQALLILLR